MLIIYESRVVIWGIFKSGTTLKFSFEGSGDDGSLVVIMFTLYTENPSLNLL